MKFQWPFLSLFGILLISHCSAENLDDNQLIHALPFNSVTFQGEFWGARQEVLQHVTIRHMLDQCEKTGRTGNFDLAAAALKGEKTGEYHTSYPFDDSDVYKVIEAASYLLHNNKDSVLDKAVDRLIERIAAAQEKDGYLYTARTFGGRPPQDWIGDNRWASLYLSHELYNIGHLMEAALAHRLATGKTTLWAIAESALNLVMKEFGPGKRENPPGHQEIELALIQWYKVGRDPRHLDLARFFLDSRGNHSRRESYGEYSQDHLPIALQDKAVGHSVRAMYMYAAMADLMAMGLRPEYRKVLETVWTDIISKKMYLTGGLGSDGSFEGFGPAYHLPNLTAYAETCASVAAFFWQQRMFLASGDSRYVDVMERMLYNGILSGISQSGDRFFYTNPLASEGKVQRKSWFGCACCPPNVSRLIASLGGYVYALQDNMLYVNFYAQNRAVFNFIDQSWTVTQTTRYPYDGTVRMAISPRHPTQATLKLRIPGWARGKPVPSDLYRQHMPPLEPVKLKLNGREKAFRLVNGYAEIRRTWTTGDSIELTLPMPVQQITAHPAVTSDRGRQAIERGPLVYCMEDPDNEGQIQNRTLPMNVHFHVIKDPHLFGGIEKICAEGRQRNPEQPGSASHPVTLTWIPYHCWAQRTPSGMRVWISNEEETGPFTAVQFRND